MNESDVEMTVPAETGETRAIHGSEAAPQIDPITSKAQLQDVITAIPSPTKVQFYLMDIMKLVLWEKVVYKMIKSISEKRSNLRHLLPFLKIFAVKSSTIISLGLIILERFLNF